MMLDNIEVLKLLKDFGITGLILWLWWQDSKKTAATIKKYKSHYQQIEKIMLDNSKAQDAHKDIMQQLVVLIKQNTSAWNICNANQEKLFDRIKQIGNFDAKKNMEDS